MSANSSLPYMGSKISLISRALIRYEGILVNINTIQHTVTLINVRSFGTEDRVIGAEATPPSNEIFQSIVFEGKQIKDITVSELAAPDDPAIVAINPYHASGTSSRPGTGNSGMPADSSSMLHHHHQSHHPSMGGTSNRRDQSGPAVMTAYMMGAGQQSMMGLGNGGSANQMDFYLEQPGNSRYSGGNSGHNMYQNHHHSHRGPYGRYHQHNYNPHRIVGELEPQPNSSLKVMVESAFNFEEANSKFDKSSISEIAESNDIDKTETGTTNPSKVECIYDKSTFFDHISCESLDRQNGHHIKIDPSKQRQLDLETFGPSARQGRGGRSTGYRGGGYYHQHRNQRMYGGHPHHMPMQNPVQMGVDYLQLNGQSSGYHPAAAVGASRF